MPVQDESGVHVGDVKECVASSSSWAHIAKGCRPGFQEHLTWKPRSQLKQLDTGVQSRRAHVEENNKVNSTGTASCKSRRAHVEENKVGGHM